MLKLDNTLLEEIGLGGLPDAQKRQMLQHIYDTLELRVGTHLANQMTDKQLEEFEKFIDAGGDANQAQALQWLEANLPNYKQVVQDTFEALKAEVKQMAPQLLAAAAAQPQEAQIVSQPTTPPQSAPPQPYTQPPVQPSYSSPAPQQPSQQFGVPSPGQVMPSQQAPADSNQAFQQSSAYTQQPQSAFAQAPVPGAGGFAQPLQSPVGQPFVAQSAIPQSPPAQADPFAVPSPQPTAPQFGQSGQPQDSSAQPGPVADTPISSPWQPPTPPVNPTDSAWQPRPTAGQEPPQGMV